MEHSKITDYFRWDDFAADGKVSTDQLLDDGISSKDARALIDTLNDEASPGVIDEGELRNNPSLLDQCKLVARPPIMARLRRLANKATDWCIFNKCKEDRPKAAREFATYAENGYLLSSLSRMSLIIYAEEAEDLASSGDKEISAIGETAANLIDSAINLYTELNQATCMLPSLGIYMPSKVSPTIIPGLKHSIEYWNNVYSTKDNQATFATKFGKERPRTIDYNGDIDANIKRDLVRLNNELGCNLVNGKKGKIGGWKCKEPKKDYYTYLKGRSEQKMEAALRFSVWQRHLEKIFTDYDLPPYFAAIAIVESDMKVDAVSYDKKGNPLAVGPYQIVREVADAQGLYINDSMGIDERKNIILSAVAAAEELRQARDGIMQEGFVDGVTFDDKDFANLVATSAYNAGFGWLRKALRQAKKELQKTMKQITAERLLVYLLTTDFNHGAYREDSKDYPPQLHAAASMAYDSRFKLEPTVDAVLVELSGLKKEIGLLELMDMLVISKRKFLQLNPQYDKNKVKEIKLPYGKNGSRFLLPSYEVERLKYLLITKGYIDKGGYTARGQP